MKGWTKERVVLVGYVLEIVGKIKKIFNQSRFLESVLAEAGNCNDLPIPPTLIPVASIDPVEMSVVVIGVTWCCLLSVLAKRVAHNL